ncbi:thiamine pyrophosphate-binding protein [Caldimonas tepidiphila]|uniref:thiamine pyrophosphate-binding protein n=1 Tax=Caldimonas tepidiphila TaxID=2315841 RepID=UPI000E5AB018|nr:thiamine pyrophosphate-binding protein [Caldimonas tepidiphila]
MLRLNGAQALVHALRTENVRHVFGVVGGKLAPLLHAISREPGLRYSGVRHEAAGPLMAAAVHASSGQVAVALGEMGPGSLNLAAGVGTALNNNLPLLLVTTNQHRAAAYPASGMFMDLDTQAVLRPLVKWNAVVHDPRRMPELVRRAFREALSGRPGPVHLDIPQDVLAASADFADDEFELPAARYRATVGPRPAAESVEAAAALLRTARRPLLVAGGGVVASGAAAQVQALAERLGAPVVPTQMALGVVPSTSPHFIGHGGLIGGDAVIAAFEQADAIVAVGCRFSSWMWDERGPFARRHHKLISINTDPSALGQPAVHEVAMQADARLALDDLLAALGAGPESAAEADWLPGLRSVRERYEARLQALAREEAEVMHPAALARAVAAAMPADALAVYDGGHTTFWSNDFTPVADVRTRFHDPGMSQLGFGLPYAIALQLLHPGRPVFNLTGDGAFGFTLQELDTARRLKLPVVTVVHNNAAWGVIRAGQRAALDFEFGTSLEDTDYAAIARGFGCHGETVTQPHEVAPALARALASGLPAVLDCRTRFEPHPAMPAFGRMNRFGFEGLTRTSPASLPPQGDIKR